MRRSTVSDIQELKARGQKIVALTAYDYPSARVADESGVDLILVGDSLGMVVLGYDSTLPVTMEEMLHHTQAVVKGAQRCFVVADLPFMSYQASIEDALRNAGRLLQEAGCQAVKLEGGSHMAETVRRLVQVGIPVAGHLGLTPQAVHQLGGYKVQGRTCEAARQLIEDALALEEAGAFCLVLETIPGPLGELISRRLRIPTIGIGAGAGCDGQIQVWHDLFSIWPDSSSHHVPRHAKHYADLGRQMREGIGRYADEVRSEIFPTAKESFGIDESVVKELLAEKG